MLALDKKIIEDGQDIAGHNVAYVTLIVLAMILVTMFLSGSLP